MPYTKRRNCPICCKANLLSLSHHLSQVHNLSSDERKPWLKTAVFSPPQSFQPSFPYFGMPQFPASMIPQIPGNLPPSRNPKPSKSVKIEPVNCLETKAYPEFKFQHMFSMLVVGPSQCGKTYFVQQLLSKKCIEFPEKKALQVYWFYNQWQPRYDEIKQLLKKKIQFTQGLPQLSEDLQEINPVYNNVLVFDDLMARAVDSPELSRLFTQGRHRNASTILLLQNMFPKGKYNTDISRNASYAVLFRSPADRKQIDIVAERTFAKDRGNFMKAYAKETDKPFGYIVVDNRPQMRNDKQVIANVFENCYTYPNIMKREPEQGQNQESTSETVKRKAESQFSTAKKQKTAVKKKSVKEQKKQVKRSKKPAKKSVKKPTKKLAIQPKERFTRGYQDMYEEISSDENFPERQSEEYEEPSEYKRSLTFEQQLNEIARQDAEKRQRENPRFAFRIH